MKKNHPRPSVLAAALLVAAAPAFAQGWYVGAQFHF
jgi:hypothetical protein